MEKLLTTYHWLKLSTEQRAVLVETFNINRSRGTEMNGNIIVSTGHTVEDLRAVNVESMKAYTKSKSDDFDELYTETIVKVDKTIEKHHKEEQEKKEAELRAGLIASVDSLTSSILESIKKLPIEGIYKVKEEVDLLITNLVGTKDVK